VPGIIGGNRHVKQHFMSPESTGPR